MNWLGISVVVYGVIMALGGVLGFLKGRSVPSLMAGGGSGILLGILGFYSAHHPTKGFGGAALIALVLEVIFIRRYVKTKNPMPSLGLAAISGLMLTLLVIGHFVMR